MNKKRLTILLLAAISAQANAFRFNTDGDFKIRWDNSFKFNAMSRVAKQDKDVYTVQGASSDRSNGWFIADDSDLSVDRGGAGLVSTRLDVLSEMDIVWKQNFGLRVSGSAWYDPQYDDDNNDHPSNRRLTWASPSTPVGEYNHEAEDLHYAGGELLDAFAFANVDIGENTSLGIRAGRHTIYWGQALLANGAVHGIGGAMAPIDFTKALSVPGSEAKELFMPTGKISSVLQLGPNLTLNAYYSYEFQAYRMPEDGTYWSPVEGLTENSEFLTLIPGETVRSGFKMRGYSEDTGDYGFNLQYYVEPWGLDASFVYINYTDKNLHGLVGGLGSSNTPSIDLDAGVNYLGEAKWVFKNDIELFGVALAKDIAGISVGVDIVYRKDTGLGPNLQAALLQPAAVFEDADSGNYPGAVGDTWHVNVSALHLLNGDWSLWDGGTALVEATFSMLDSCNENCQVLDTRINEDRVISQIAAVFKPTWYQVRPGWDLSFPMTVSYTIDGEKSPINFGGDEEGGTASIGAQVDINQVWLATVAYNNRFGPVLAGTGGLLKDRDNISLTIKRTF
jgi:hypothetical protein